MARRLTWWLTGGIVVFWLAACAVSALVMREEFDEAFDSSLQETAQRLIPLVVDDLFQRDSSADPWRVDGSSGEKEYLTYQLRNAKGEVLLHSHDAQTEPFDVPLRQGFADTPEHRIYTEAAVSGTLFLQVADRFDLRWEATRESVVSLLLPILLIAPLSMMAIWYLIRRSLSPLGTLRQEIGARDGANLRPVSVDTMPAELKTIGASVNRLMERLRTALDAEREFAANSAHELRTPIAGALAQTQRLIVELPEGPVRQRARGIETSLSALGHLAEKLLQLARADSGIGTAVELLDVVPIVRLVVEEFARKPANTGRVDIDLSGLGDDKVLMRRFDVDALGIILRNLIENALLHGSEGRAVIIAVTTDGTITVSNGGPIVPELQLAELKTRFIRGASPAPGAGLGLSIADSLAKQMGASLDFASPAHGFPDGFEARLRLSAL